jgi:hypothetical protein
LYIILYVLSDIYIQYIKISLLLSNRQNRATVLFDSPEYLRPRSPYQIWVNDAIHLFSLVLMNIASFLNNSIYSSSLSIKGIKIAL